MLGSSVWEIIDAPIGVTDSLSYGECARGVYTPAVLDQMTILNGSYDTHIITELVCVCVCVCVCFLDSA